MQEATAKKIWNLLMRFSLWSLRISPSEWWCCWDIILEWHLQKLFAIVLGLILLPYHLEFLSFILEKMRKKSVPLHAVSFHSPWIFRLLSVDLSVLFSLLFHCKDNHCTVASDGIYVAEIVFGEILQPCALCRDLIWIVFHDRGPKRGRAWSSKNCNLFFCLRIM